MKWRVQKRVELDGVRGDALLYREYTLAGIWPRSVPDYFDDDIVSEKLNECAETEILPWSGRTLR